MMLAAFTAAAKQDWKGKVVDEKGEPVAYANVAVPAALRADGWRRFRHGWSRFHFRQGTCAIRTVRRADLRCRFRPSFGTCTNGAITHLVIICIFAKMSKL